MSHTVLCKPRSPPSVWAETRKHSAEVCSSTLHQIGNLSLSCLWLLDAGRRRDSAARHFISRSSCIRQSQRDVTPAQSVLIQESCVRNSVNRGGESGATFPFGGAVGAGFVAFAGLVEVALPWSRAAISASTCCSCACNCYLRCVSLSNCPCRASYSRRRCSS